MVCKCQPSYTSASEKDLSLLRLVKPEFVYVLDRDCSSWKALSSTFKMDLRLFSLKSWPINTYSKGFRQLFKNARLVAIGTPIVVTWSKVSLNSAATWLTSSIRAMMWYGAQHRKNAVMTAAIILKGRPDLARERFLRRRWIMTA